MGGCVDPVVAHAVQADRPGPRLAHDMAFVGRERAQNQCQPLGEAATDHHQLRLGDGSAHPAEVAGDHLPQPAAPLCFAVAELGAGCTAASLAQRPQPVASRKGRKVGLDGPEVDPARGERQKKRRNLGPLDGRAPGAVRHPRRRSGPAAQVALRLELRIAVDDQPPRDAQLGRQPPRGRDPLPGLQTARLDRLAQRTFELDTERFAECAVQPQRQLGIRTGPLDRHATGPYRRTAFPPC